MWAVWLPALLTPRSYVGRYFRLPQLSGGGPTEHLLLPALIRTASTPGPRGGPGRYYPTGWASAQTVPAVKHITLPALPSSHSSPTRWHPAGRATTKNMEGW